MSRHHPNPKIPRPGVPVSIAMALLIGTFLLLVSVMWGIRDTRIAFAQDKGQPDIVVEPLKLEFGPIIVSKTGQLSLKITNAGNADLVVNSVTLPPGVPFDFCGKTLTGFLLGPGESVTIDVCFSPTETGKFEDEILIQSNDPDEPAVTVPVSGDGGEKKHKLAFLFCYTLERDRTGMNHPDAPKKFFDCKKVRAALIDTWHFPKGDIKVHDDLPETKQADRKVTNANIKKVLGKDLLAKLEAICQKDPPEKAEVFIFFSGHGGDGKFIMSDGHTKITAAELEAIVTKILGKECLKALVLAIDACFAEGMLPNFDKLPNKEKLIFGYASKNNGLANGCIQGERYNHAWSHAVFKNGVHEKLADEFGGIGNNDKKVSVEEAFKLGKKKIKKGGPDFKDGDPANDLELDPFAEDSDNDGIPDSVDNCVFTPNPDQANLDGDPVGDACDLDDDQDEWLDEIDNCPQVFNHDQADLQRDLDADGLGDVCDPDVDGDGINNDSDPDDDNDTILDVNDNCLNVPNLDQTDTDGDGDGDACSEDDDADGFDDLEELAYGSDPLDISSVPEFVDLLGTCNDAVDNDGDGLADQADPDCQDIDGDGVPDARDNCPAVPNGQLDLDDDGLGNECDPDDDGDGVADEVDNCPAVPNPDQKDSNNDGIGDACELPVGVGGTTSFVVDDGDSSTGILVLAGTASVAFAIFAVSAWYGRRRWLGKGNW